MPSGEITRGSVVAVAKKSTKNRESEGGKFSSGLLIDGHGELFRERDAEECSKGYSYSQGCFSRCFSGH